MEQCREGNDNSLESFKNRVRKVSGKRHYRITNSYGVYDGFKYYRKNRPEQPEYRINESQYFAIIRGINKLLAESFVRGNIINFPHKMGKLELRKYEAKITFDGKKIKTNLPVDWESTLKLWYEDEESHQNKTLIKREEKEIYKICYDKRSANFNNKSFYQFIVNRDLKKAVKHGIKEENLDAFKL